MNLLKKMFGYKKGCELDSDTVIDRVEYRLFLNDRLVYSDPSVVKVYEMMQDRISYITINLSEYKTRVITEGQFTYIYGRHRNTLISYDKLLYTLYIT